jgi:hypothetical protein
VSRSQRAWRSGGDADGAAVADRQESRTARRTRSGSPTVPKLADSAGVTTDGAGVATSVRPFEDEGSGDQREMTAIAITDLPRCGRR